MFLKNHSYIVLTLLSSFCLLDGMADESDVKREKYYYDYNNNDSNLYLEQIKKLKSSELEEAIYRIFDWRTKQIVVIKDTCNFPVASSSKDVSRV